MPPSPAVGRAATRSQASAWLLQLPADSSKDAAIVAFSDQVFEDDPQASYRWAESVSDPSARQSNVYNILSRWVRADPTDGTAAIQSSTLSDEQKGPAFTAGGREELIVAGITKFPIRLPE